jgi:uroporphyrinogen decarboxylase
VNERERFLTTMNHQLPDRIPTVMDARIEAQEALKNHYGVGSYQKVLDIMGAVDIYRFPHDDWIKVNFPGYDEKAELVEGRWMSFNRGIQKYIKIDKKTFKDAWGAVWKISDNEGFAGWVSGPLVEAKDPDEIFIPRINDIVDDPDLPRRVRELKEKGVFVRGTVTQVYKTAWMLRGMENVLMDYLINRPFIEKLYDKLYELQGEILRRMTKAGMDMIGFEGDIAMQHSLIMGPDTWRAVDKPRLAKVIASCKEINPNVHVFIHSDGDISEIMPDLIEIGFDVIDPIQPECMDPIEIKKLYGDKITLHRCGSLQRTLPFGTPKDCKKEAVTYIEQCGQNGGLVLGASNTIGYDVPVENVVAWYEAVRDYIL